MTLNKSNPDVTTSAKAKSEIQAKKDYRRSNVRRRGEKDQIFESAEQKGRNMEEKDSIFRIGEEKGGNFQMYKRQK